MCLVCTEEKKAVDKLIGESEWFNETIVKLSAASVNAVFPYPLQILIRNFTVCTAATDMEDVSFDYASEETRGDNVLVLSNLNKI